MVKRMFKKRKYSSKKRYGRKTRSGKFSRGQARPSLSYRFVKGKCKQLEQRKKIQSLREFSKTETPYYYYGRYVGGVNDEDNETTAGSGFHNASIGATHRVLVVSRAQLLADSRACTAQWVSTVGRPVFVPYWPINQWLPKGANPLKAGINTGAIVPRAFGLLSNNGSSHPTTNSPHNQSLMAGDMDVDGQSPKTYTLPPWTKCIVASWDVCFTFQNKISTPVNVSVYLFKIHNDVMLADTTGFQGVQLELWEKVVSNGRVVSGTGDWQERAMIDYLRERKTMPPKFFKVLKKKTVYLHAGLTGVLYTEKPAQKVITMGVRNMHRTFTKTGLSDAETDQLSSARMFDQYLFDNYYLSMEVEAAGAISSLNNETTSVAYSITKRVKYYLK